MEAVILAGGLGTRLQSTLPDIPKPMAPVGGKPFLWYLFKWIARYPISRIVLSTGYKSEEISEYFGDSFESMSLEYAIEEKPLGTGGGLMNATRRLTGSDFIVINGDTYFPIDLKRLFLYHTGHCGFITIALKRMTNFSRYGSVECKGDLIVRFNEKKPCADGLINGGIYAISRKLLMEKEFPEVFSLEEDLLGKSAGNGTLRCMTFEEPFLDIGIPEDYGRASELLKA